MERVLWKWPGKALMEAVIRLWGERSGFKYAGRMWEILEARW